ncbi:MaoC family dehydratase N-terminal domain-containing protein [Pseudonocardia ailaonensis]|uniref:MaoC family dehydratase N-terminal domain-containing protein n=1 Tax=Pseudonocardia ailaonensis TaxID=367279 RepID=A0ABN2N7W9_9PSEU
MSIEEHIRGWEPAPVEVVETIRPEPSTAFAGLLDQAPPTGSLPPLWTAFHFLELPTTAELGEDGHTREGHFLPPVPNRRRMFAGGRLRITAPIGIGDEIVRRSGLTSITPKSGRSGEMLFVTLTNEYLRDGEVVQVEEQDIVYRQQEPGAARAAAPSAPSPVEPPAAAPDEWQAVLRPDEVLLFRMSALTYNAHRIHHDLPYTRDVEGFPGLVVHGPLLALMLLELPRRFAPDRRVAEFSYRLRRPAFCGAPVVATGKPDGSDLACGVPGADPAITGSVTFA